MSKNTKEQKLNHIELQIEKLKEKRKKLEEKMHLSIGKKVVKEWNIEEEKTAILLIEQLKPHVQEILERNNIPLESQSDDQHEQTS